MLEVTGSGHPQPSLMVWEPTDSWAPAPSHYPNQLGAIINDTGVQFGLFASHATAVELCLFDRGPDGTLTERRLRLYGPTDGIWHGSVPGLRPGQHYGYRVHGPWKPSAGMRHNPAKLMLDPYTRGIQGTVELVPQIYGHQVDSDLYPITNDLAPDYSDSSPYVPLSVVTSTNFPVAPGPRTPWENTVIYEAHVRGLTIDMPGIPAELRGTYAGLANPVTIDYLKNLGVTAVELLPIHASMAEPFLTERGLTNYWGYSTLAFFAPEPSYATKAAQMAGPQAVLDEVRGMVSLLHQAGIEVLLDVVYNHTCEGGNPGPSLSLRGIDNTAYYLHDQGSMLDVTGCGNSLDFRNANVVRLALDSLRYWATQVGIDGFRFDLATTLGRNANHFSPSHPFFVALASDPVLSGLKMIAEPWDVGYGGWQTGNFPIPFSDWNDKYRDAIRTFWLADTSELSRGRRTHGPHELATRLSGSADMFSHGQLPGGRGPRGTINYVAAHDGFTMHDMVTYDHKQNEDNLEDNRDGTNANYSWNHGIEGPVWDWIGFDHTGGSIDPDMAANASAVLPLRLRNMRNLFGTLLVSAGTPMILAGDEFGRTQCGNNNAYCQDNEISWLDWDTKEWQEALRNTVRYLLELRRAHPVLRPSTFATGTVMKGDVIPDLSWYDAHGKTLTPAGWHNPGNRVLQMLRSGLPHKDEDALVIINGMLDQVTVTPPAGRGRVYRLVWDSTWPDPMHRIDDDEETPFDFASFFMVSQPTTWDDDSFEVEDLPGPAFAAEVGAKSSSPTDLAAQLTGLAVDIPGLPTQMEALSMRIYLAKSE
ncbi:MAG: glycogen debranching protein GlgX [Actinomycetaceae bacterium]|nr:glycogen debranching protein GlgX [Actinomycetaceae bacterium]